MIVLAAVVVVPLLLSFYSSFTPFRLTKPETFFVFIGPRNYVILASTGISGSRSAAPCCCSPSRSIWKCCSASAWRCWSKRPSRGQRMLRTIMMFPMMFSPILVGFQFKFMFNDNIGLVNNALQSLGLTDQASPG